MAKPVFPWAISLPGETKASHSNDIHDAAEEDTKLILLCYSVTIYCLSSRKMRNYSGQDVIFSRMFNSNII